MKRTWVRWLLVGIGVLAVAGLGAWLWFRAQLAPTAPGPEFLIRIAQPTPLEQVLRDLGSRGAVRNPAAAGFYARWRKRPPMVETGTYRLRPGMTPDALFLELRKPLRQMVRLPEGWWIARVAKRLEEKNVCSAEEYIEMAGRPDLFRDVVAFPLPKDSLEGYLFPDTYDLPPLLGAEETIRRQLRAFESKVVKPLKEPKDLHRLVIVGSLIEAEVAADEERPIVAGIIENRLAQKMRLQIDATVLYALQEWKQLGPGVVNTIDSPYNTYRIAGLPPGPIGSPGVKSIAAAANPQPTPHLYYVALPTGKHLFSPDYAGHLANIRKRKAALKALEP